jgi:hypothetical protein
MLQDAGRIESPAGANGAVSHSQDWQTCCMRERSRLYPPSISRLLAGTCRLLTAPLPLQGAVHPVDGADGLPEEQALRPVIVEEA